MVCNLFRGVRSTGNSCRPPSSLLCGQHGRKPVDRNGRWFGPLGNQHLITYLREISLQTFWKMSTAKSGSRIAKPATPPYPLCQVVDTTIRCYGSDDGVPPFDAQPLAQDRSGNLWVGGDTKLLTWRLGSSKVWLGPSQVYSPRPLQSGAGTGGGVRALAVAADGSLWVGMQLAGQGGLQHIVDGALKSFVTPKLNGETLGVNALLADRQNSLWVGTTNQGIYRIRGKEVEHFRITDGLSSDSVWTFLKIARVTFGWLPRRASTCSVTFT